MLLCILRKTLLQNGPSCFHSTSLQATISGHREISACTLLIPNHLLVGVPAIIKLMSQCRMHSLMLHPHCRLAGNLLTWQLPPSDVLIHCCSCAFPLTPVDWGALASHPTDAIQAVWVGHATVLVQLGGLCFITDPIFSDRCAPTQWAGPKVRGCFVIKRVIMDHLKVVQRRVVVSSLL